ncbi:hypothetical protein ACSMDC_14595 [Yersinia enterocolitica]|uniref:hypothetical protein n=1 Tax=Yersinia enterocolitica TaxID=630 RepID=UPI0003116763
MTLSAIRGITDKDDGPSEPPWTAAKSALEQEATRAGSIRPAAAGGNCESSNILRKPQVQEGRPTLLLG